MKRLLALVPLLVVATLGVGPAPGRPARHHTPTPTPTPEADELEPPEPTPTPEPPRFLAALESTQGEGGERVAVFADGTLVRTTRWRTRTTTRRLLLTRQELDVVRRVLAEALAATDEDSPRADVLSGGSERKMRMEIAAGDGGPPRVFLFDDASPLPLAAGRARGALEDLRRRFESRTPVGAPVWDTSDVQVDDRLRRKTDGRWFVVVRDDTFERNLELHTVEGDLIIWVTRQELARTFYDPSAPSPDPAPRERPE